jgi:hypothetical protein
MLSMKYPAFVLHSEPSMCRAFSRRAPRNPSLLPDALRLLRQPCARRRSIVRRPSHSENGQRTPPGF